MMGNLDAIWWGTNVFRSFFAVHARESSAFAISGFGAGLPIASALLRNDPTRACFGYEFSE
jgi:hypothetical protein